MTMTESKLKTGKAVDLGYDASLGAWVAVCQQHNNAINVASRDRVRQIKNTSEFCEDCRDVQDEPGDNVVTFSAAQTDPVTKQQLDAMSEMLTGAHDQWLAEELAKQSHEPEPVKEPEPIVEDEPVEPAEPIIGTYFAASGETAHYAVAISGQYMRTVCTPTGGMLMGDECFEEAALCQSCVTGKTLPANGVVAEPPKRPRGRPRKNPVEPVAPEPAMYPVLTDALLEAVAKLEAAMADHPNASDATKAIDILGPAVDSMRQYAPRRRVGRPTGERSGLVKQSKTVNLSDEMLSIEPYVQAGDARAVAISEHVKAYKPGEDCSYCMDKRGVSTRHAYASAFCSIGREIKAMKVRLPGV